MPPPSPQIPRPVSQSKGLATQKERQIPFSPGLGLKATVEEYLRPEVGELEKETTEDFAEHELDLTGIDDDEIESFLLTPEEVKFKTQLWMKVNEEYLQEQCEKLKKEKEEREEMIKQGIDPDRKKRVYRKRKSGSSDTAVEAIEKMAVEKKISTKINYDVLKNLTVVQQSPLNDEVIKSPSKEENSAPETFLSPSVSTPLSLKNFPSIGTWGSKKIKIGTKPTLVTRSVPKKQVISEKKLIETTASNPDEADQVRTRVFMTMQTMLHNKSFLPFLVKEQLTIACIVLNANSNLL